MDEKSRKAVPITQFVDVPNMLQDMEELSRSAGKARFKLYSKVKAWNSLQKHFKQQLAPPGLTFTKFLQTLQGMTNKKLGRDGKDGTFTYRTLLVAGMHFPGRLQLRHRTGEALRHSLRHARRQAVSVLHLQLRAVLSREDRATVLDSLGPEDAAADHAHSVQAEDSLTGQHRGTEKSAGPRAFLTTDNRQLATAFLPRGPLQIPPAEQVQMQMENRLS